MFVIRFVCRLLRESRGVSWGMHVAYHQADMWLVNRETKSFVFFQAEDGIRDLVRSRGLGDVYKRQLVKRAENLLTFMIFANA